MGTTSYVNPANAMTASRYLTLPLFAYFIDNGDGQWAMIMLIICALLDVFDGKVAVLLGCTSAFGELFDAITDAICYGFMMIWLTAYGLLPWPAITIIICAGAYNAVLRAAYARRVGRVTNFRSLAMERVVAFTACLPGFGIAQFETHYYAYGCAVFILAVVAHDTKRMLLDPVPA